MFNDKYQKPSVAVDCIVFGLDEEDLKVILIQRDLEPFQGRWALPGGFVHIDESLEEAAMRELREETGIEKVFLEQLYTFGKVGRDPRERVISVAYYALVNLREYTVVAATDARNAAWFGVDDIPDMPFDHNLIFAAALKRLQGKVRYEPIGFELLPAKFTLTQLQKMYEKILGQEIDKRNFRKKILSMGLLEELNEVEIDVAHRAARLYRFDAAKYRKLKENGFDFEI
ncbi:MAG: NUDIX domain-containing protein [Smithella sp.]